MQHAASVYGRRPTGSIGESVLTPAPCDSVQEASGHSPSEPLSSKSDPDEGTDLHKRRPGLSTFSSSAKRRSEAADMRKTCPSVQIQRDVHALL